MAVREDFRSRASKGRLVDWGRLEGQLAALRETVAEGARSSAGDAERVTRSLDRLEALERLLAPGEARPSDPAEARPSDPAKQEAQETTEPGRSRRASLHRSPLADLFRDTEIARRPD